MCKPVIFDDGGSLRIREMEDNVTMDGLLDPTAAPVPSNQNFLSAGVFQCTLTVRYMDEFGVFTTLPLANGLYGLALAAGDTVTIASAKNKAVITFPSNPTKPLPNNTLSILVSTSATAALEGARRRYLISSFGKVDTVTQTGGKTFDLSRITRSFTMVHFSPDPPTAKVANVEQKKEKEHDEGRRHHH